MGGLMDCEIRLQQSFVKRMDNLAAIFGLSVQEVREARVAIIDAIELLAAGKALPDYYADHELKREPWSGFHEFHVMDDLLVVYYRIDTKKRIRMVTITNHQELLTGKL